MAKSRTYYEVLGVCRNDDESTIREQYHKLARLHHPDKCGGVTSQEFLDIQRSWETLSDCERKLQYDDTLKVTDQTMIQKERSIEKPAVVWCSVGLDEMYLDDDCYCYRCRCGDEFDILIEEIEKGSVYILPCPGCTLKLRLNTA